MNTIDRLLNNSAFVSAFTQSDHNPILLVGDFNSPSISRLDQIDQKYRNNYIQSNPGICICSGTRKMYIEPNYVYTRLRLYRNRKYRQKRYRASTFLCLFRIFLLCITELYLIKVKSANVLTSYVYTLKNSMLFVYSVQLICVRIGKQLISTTTTPL
jgi:hypothetical protein